MSYAPTHLPSPEPLPPAASAVPVTEETDLRVQQVPWEGRDVTIPAVTPTFSSTSRPAASLKSHVTPALVTCRLVARDSPTLLPCASYASRTR